MKDGLKIVIGVCWAYWLYLLFSSRMIIIYDGDVFEWIGRLIYQKGWIEFFRQGPFREPIYPFLISVSMHMEDWLGISYQYVQKVIQFLLLFASQMLIWKLLGEMKVRRDVSLGLILYFGFSPAMVNAALSLWSEIAALPFVLLVVWFGFLSMKAVHRGTLGDVLLIAVATSLAFLGAMCVKGIFQYIFIVYLLCFVILGVLDLLRPTRHLIKYVGVYVAVSAVIVFSFLHLYRTMNLKYNGNYEMTDRYDANLFGVTWKRSEPHTIRMFLAQIASTAGSGVCNKFFDEKTCKYCEFYSMEENKSRLGELLKDTPKGQVHNKTLMLAFERMKLRPFQYASLTFLETFKMAFWESTQVGFVLYPPWMEAVYKNTLFKNGVRLAATVLTYVGLIFGLVHVFMNRKALLDFRTDKTAPLQIECLVLGIIIVFTGLYALYPILTRFAFPIVPLYFLSFGFFCQKYLMERNK